MNGAIGFETGYKSIASQQIDGMINRGVSSQAACQVAHIEKEAYASAALKETEEMVSWALAISRLVEEKLGPILDPIGSEEACSHGKAIPPLPPMFEEWRASRNKLYEALRSIEKTLLRVNL